MGIVKPYRRTFRPFKAGSGNVYNTSHYITHNKYAKSPEHYIRAFLLLQKDMQELFDYVEPADNNESCYSYRIHELLLRACVEVEANCKAIMVENGYTKSKNLCMGDYKKINNSHRLSSYEIKFPFWQGNNNVRKPFSAWPGGSLDWYVAYNAVKHDRSASFEKATFVHLVNAICGVSVLLSSQFQTQTFAPGNMVLISGCTEIGMESAIGEFFLVKFPDNWTEEEKYEFDWQSLKKSDSDPFQEFNYPT